MDADARRSRWCASELATPGVSGGGSQNGDLAGDDDGDIYANSFLKTENGALALYGSTTATVL